MRFLFVVRFREHSGKNDGFGNIKAFRTVAKDQKAAARRMRKKGQILSVRKVKKII